MKVKIYAVLMLVMILGLSACGGGDSVSTPTFTTQILSNPLVDGDIEQISPIDFRITPSNSQSVQVGIDPVTGTETKAFLHFPLRSVGNDVPLNAFIKSAFLDIVITIIDPLPLNGTIPIRIDLISFPPPLAAEDFDKVVLASTTISPPISQIDSGTSVPVDVTTLMIAAQDLGLTNFQIRIQVGDGFVTPGIIEINDTNALAPLLEVTYF